jgi:hypothetical protein
MNAPVADPIRTLLGSIPDEEHEQRRRIMSCRNVASYRVTRSSSAAARALLWTVCDCANGYVFAPQPVDLLAEVATFCRRLLMCADMAERLMEDGDGLD